jgi:hypothetical protein
MSRHIITAGPKYDPLSELDIDELVERLTPGKMIAWDSVPCPKQGILNGELSQYH